MNFSIKRQPGMSNVHHPIPRIITDYKLPTYFHPEHRSDRRTNPVMEERSWYIDTLIRNRLRCITFHLRKLSTLISKVHFDARTTSTRENESNVYFRAFEVQRAIIELIAGNRVGLYVIH